MIKIVFISGTPISKITGEKIDPYWYQNHGFEVEYWGMQNIYYDQASIDGYFSGHIDYKYNFPNARNLCSKNKVAQALKDLDDETIICFIDFGMQFDFWILRLFKRYKVLFYIGPRSIPIDIDIPAAKNKFLAKNKIVVLYKKIFKKFFFKRVNNKVLKAVFRHTDYYQHPTYIFSCGTKGHSTYSEVPRKTNYISIPSVDISWEKTPLLISHKYCVFVENNLHFSPDASLNGVNNDEVDIRLYEKNICKMFELIEEVLGAEVIISASGKYKYSDENIFGKREIIYYKTNQLIQHSEMVIGHWSQGLSQSIVSLKPLMLINDISFSLFIQNVIDGVAEIFKTKAIYATELTPDLIRQQLAIDKKHYHYLNQEYFSEEGIDTDSRELIGNAINNCFDHR